MSTEEEKKEVKVETTLEASVKKRLVRLLHEYMDVVSWSYQDILGLDTNMVENRLSLVLECPPLKQKLRRTRSDMSIKTVQCRISNSAQIPSMGC